MIHRILILLIILLVLPELYSGRIHRRRHSRWPQWRQNLRWAPVALMLVFTFWLAAQTGFIPDNSVPLFIYLGLLGVIFIPRFIYMLSSFVGKIVKVASKGKNNWGNLVGLILAILTGISALYGFTIGRNKLVVKNITLEMESLPDAFDGYKIAHFSDIHIGSISDSFLEKAVKKINEQKADMIAFTGDLQNIQPQELYQHDEVLSKLRARDGVYSILGNHDYSTYQKYDDNAIRIANEKELVSRERQMGWHLLLNENKTISRGKDKMIIAGMEDGEKGPSHQKPDITKALDGVKKNDFIIMLEHDPKQWKKLILPQSNAQLTLSGHTHGGQISIFGLRPTMITTSEDYGLYDKEGRYLYVTGGIGGLVPFRLGLSPEIVVITLKKKQEQKE